MTFVFIHLYGSDANTSFTYFFPRVCSWTRSMICVLVLSPFRLFQKHGILSKSSTSLEKEMNTIRGCRSVFVSQMETKWLFPISLLAFLFRRTQIGYFTEEEKNENWKRKWFLFFPFLIPLTWIRGASKLHQFLCMLLFRFCSECCMHKKNKNQWFILLASSSLSVFWNVCWGFRSMCFIGTIKNMKKIAIHFFCNVTLCPRLLHLLHSTHSLRRRRLRTAFYSFIFCVSTGSKYANFFEQKNKNEEKKRAYRLMEGFSTKAHPLKTFHVARCQAY